MKYLTQLAIILGIYLLGEALKNLLNLPIPGNILGMILLWLGLNFGFIKEKDIGDTADFCLVNLTLFFVAPGIQLMEDYQLIKGHLTQTILMILITTLLTLVTAGSVASFLLKRKEVKHGMD